MFRWLFKDIIEQLDKVISLQEEILRKLEDSSVQLKVERIEQGRGRKLTEKEMELLMSNLSVRKVAEELGWSVGKVHYWRKKLAKARET